MKRSLVAFMIVVAFILSAASVMAEDNLFNGASKWIASWKAPSCMTSEGATAQAPAKDMKADSCCKALSVNALGDKVPTGTVKDGKI